MLSTFMVQNLLIVHKAFKVFLQPKFAALFEGAAVLQTVYHWEKEWQHWLLYNVFLSNYSLSLNPFKPDVWARVKKLVPYLKISTRY